MDISKFIKCYLSERGHNNFWYPTKTEALIESDCQRESLSWVSGAPERRLSAIKVLKSCVLPLNFDQNGAENLSPPAKDEFIVVWIEK